MSDINKVWLSGVAVSDPILTKLPSKTPVCTFTLKVNEKFKDRSGVVQVKSSFIRIESLGKAAEPTSIRVKSGNRYTVDGYIRVDLADGVDNVRVRSFAVYADDSSDNVPYKQGIKQALEILRKSIDKQSAQEKLEELLDP